MYCVFRMDQDTVIMTYTLHRRASEAVYYIIHTREHIIQEPDMSIKLPIATLRANLRLMLS